MKGTVAFCFDVIVRMELTTVFSRKESVLQACLTEVICQVEGCSVGQEEGMPD